MENITYLQHETVLTRRESNNITVFLRSSALNYFIYNSEQGKHKQTNKPIMKHIKGPAQMDIFFTDDLVSFLINKYRLKLNINRTAHVN